MTKPTKPTDPARALRLALKRLDRAAKDVARCAGEVAAAGSSGPAIAAGASAIPAFEGKHAILIEELRRSGLASHVLKHYIGKVASLITIGTKNPRALFVEICARYSAYPERVLKLAADHTVNTRSKLTTFKQVKLDIETVARTAQIKITTNHPGWLPWLAHLRATNQGSTATFLERQEVMFQLTEYPPGHWAQQATEKAA